MRSDNIHVKSFYFLLKKNLASHLHSIATSKTDLLVMHCETKFIKSGGNILRASEVKRSSWCSLRASAVKLSSGMLAHAHAFSGYTPSAAEQRMLAHAHAYPLLSSGCSLLLTRSPDTHVAQASSCSRVPFLDTASAAEQPMLAHAHAFY